MSKNRAQQSYLILNYGGFCEIFSQNARNIHAESVSIRKFLRWVLLASERAPASPTSTASPLARASPFTAATKFPLSGKHNFPCTEIFPLRYIAYQTHLCRRCGARGGLLHSRQVSRRLCPFGSRCGRGSRRLLKRRESVAERGQQKGQYQNILRRIVAIHKSLIDRQVST